MVVISVLFGILKIIFLAIAVLLGLLIALVLVVLLSPIRYDVAVTTGNVLSDPKEIAGQATIFWFWRLLKITISHQNKATNTKIIFLGKCFVGKENKVTKSKKRAHKKKAPTASEAQQAQPIPPKQSTAPSMEPTAPPMEAKIPPQPTKTVKAPPPKEEDGSAKTGNQEHKNHKREKNKERKEEEPKEESIVEKLLSYKAQFQQYYGHPDRPILVKKAWTMVKKILKSLKPQTLRIRAVLGLEDVSVTGMVMAVVAALSGVIGADIFVQGTLEEKYLSVDGATKGRIVLMGILAPIVQFLCARPVLKIIWNYLMSARRRRRSAKRAQSSELSAL